MAEQKTWTFEEVRNQLMELNVRARQQQPLLGVISRTRYSPALLQEALIGMNLSAELYFETFPLKDNSERQEQFVEMLKIKELKGSFAAITRQFSDFGAAALQLYGVQHDGPEAFNKALEKVKPFVPVSLHKDLSSHILKYFSALERQKNAAFDIEKLSLKAAENSTLYRLGHFLRGARLNLAETVLNLPPKVLEGFKAAVSKVITPLTKAVTSFRATTVDIAQRTGQVAGNLGKKLTSKPTPQERIEPSLEGLNLKGSNLGKTVQPPPPPVDHDVYEMDDLRVEERIFDPNEIIEDLYKKFADGELKLKRTPETFANILYHEVGEDLEKANIILEKMRASSPTNEKGKAAANKFLTQVEAKLVKCAMPEIYTDNFADLNKASPPDFGRKHYADIASKVSSTAFAEATQRAQMLEQQIQKQREALRTTDGSPPDLQKSIIALRKLSILKDVQEAMKFTVDVRLGNVLEGLRNNVDKQKYLEEARTNIERKNPADIEFIVKAAKEYKSFLVNQGTKELIEASQRNLPAIGYFKPGGIKDTQELLSLVLETYDLKLGVVKEVHAVRRVEERVVHHPSTQQLIEAEKAPVSEAGKNKKPEGAKPRRDRGPATPSAAPKMA